MHPLLYVWFNLVIPCSVFMGLIGSTLGGVKGKIMLLIFVLSMAAWYMGYCYHLAELSRCGHFEVIDHADYARRSTAEWL